MQACFSTGAPGGQWRSLPRLTPPGPTTSSRLGGTPPPRSSKRQQHCQASSSSVLDDFGLQHTANGFGAKPQDKVSLAILGDLHLAPEQMHLFRDAQQQIRSHLVDPQTGQALPGSRVVQLGDLGHAKHRSGCASCFEYAKEYLSGFGIPFSLVLGNHDMEGEEYETDEDNLAGWHGVWQQPHHWAADLGPFVAIGLSTTRYRSNAFSHHEVHIDEGQMQWLEGTLAALAAQGKQVVIFTHAPPQGCGLKVIQEVHVKNRCAWLCHSERPERFLQLVERYPNIRLWFSGHFHLSQNYTDSISVVGSCAFVQTGVIGACNRDGHRQSRVLSADSQGFRVFTLDHGPAEDVLAPSPSSSPQEAAPALAQDHGATREAHQQASSSPTSTSTSTSVPPGRVSPWPSLRLDLVHRWDDLSSPSLVTPQEALITPQAGALSGWLRSEVECNMDATLTRARVTRKQAQPARWFPTGSQTILALQSGLLVEYDLRSFAPMGLVCKVPRGCEVVLRTQDGREAQADGSDAAVVEVVDLAAGGSSKYPRNPWGFAQIHQPNKWRLKQQRLAEERAAAKQQQQQQQQQAVDAL